MKSSGRTLDHNLERLLTRAWTPVQPREEFVRELESVLAPWIAEPLPSLERARRWPRLTVGIVAAVAAAALLLILARWMPEFSSDEPGRAEVEIATLESLLANGEVALRFDPSGPWRAADGDERVGGLYLAGEALELATPVAAGFDVLGAEGWSLSLEPESFLRVAHAAGGFDLHLEQGSALASNGQIADQLAAPQVLRWREGDFVDEAGRSWTAVARGPGQTPASDREELSPDPERDEDEPEDAPAASLKGRVVDAEGGEPITSFQVTLLEEVPLPQVSFPETQAHESSSGEFQRSGVDPGRYSVFVSVDGAAIWKRTGLELIADQELELLAEIEVGGSLRGFVVDAETGEAIEGALVLSEHDMPLSAVNVDASQLPPVARARTISRRDGSFELEHVSLGAHRLRASGDGFAPSWIEVQLSTPALDGLLFELGAGGGVEGRCELADGNPSAGAQVIVSRFSSGSPGSKMTYSRVLTDERGAYRVEDLSPGYYVVLLFSEREAAPQYQPRYKPVAVSEGAMARADFLGETRGASVSGVVRDADGAPLAYTSVQLWWDHENGMDWVGETTDAEGRYELLGLEPRAYQLYVGSAESTVQHGVLELEQGQHIQHDVVVEGLTFRAQLRDLVTGEALSAVDVFLAEGGPSAGRSRVVAHAFSRDDGLVLIEHVPEGEYSLLILPETGPHAWSIHPGVRVDASVEAPEVDVRLERGRRATLELTDPAGRPVQGASVRIVSPLGETWASPWTPRSDDRGLIELERLRAGTWTYSVSLEGFEPARGVLTAKAGDGTRTRVVLQPH